MNELELTGKVRTHITQIENPRFAAQSEVVEAFFQLQKAALKEGVDIQPFSSFRNYKTQVRIWNKKFSGQKPLYDIQGKEQDYKSLSENEIIDAILGWSALPGASRHHWGTEIDVIDSAAVPKDYRVKLLPEETQNGGVFAKLHDWLNKNMHHYGFFRPYQEYQKGRMFPEPWHLSYAPLSHQIMKLFTYEIAEKTIQESDILGKELVLNRLEEIYQNHILIDDTP